VLSQRVRIIQAARLRDDLIRRHGDSGAVPPPALLRTLDLDLPGRKTEYLHAVADAALEGRLDGERLRSLDPDEAVRIVQQVKGLGPFAAELVVIRGANPPTRYPITRAGWMPRSPIATGPTARCPPSPGPGARFAPGPPCTCALSGKSAPATSADVVRPMADVPVPSQEDEGTTAVPVDDPAAVIGGLSSRCH
jgi:hypothetical protein